MLRRCRYKAVLCKIDLGSDVMVRSRGNASTEVEPLLLPTGGVDEELLGWVSRGYKWCHGMFWSGSAWEKLPKSSRT